MKHTIYRVTNRQNGKIYIGAHSTDSPNDNYFGSGKLIMKAIARYGVEGFDKKVLHIFDTKDEMFAKERELVTSEFVARRDTYNVNIGGEAPPVTVHTDESRAKVSKRFKGKPLSDEQKQKISATKKAGYHPYRGKKLTEEHKEKNRQAQIGRKHSEETKAKMRANKLGKNNPNYGKTFSDEYRAKLSAAQKGRRHSPETKAKMRAARKKFYENPENRKKQSERMTGNRNAEKMDMVMVGIDYEEGKPETYNGVIVYDHYPEILARFKSNDFEKDLFKGERYARKISKVAMHSGSVDNYMSELLDQSGQLSLLDGDK
jgi:group I intron endonuclease